MQGRHDIILSSIWYTCLQYHITTFYLYHITSVSNSRAQKISVLLRRKSLLNLDSIPCPPRYFTLYALKEIENSFKDISPYHLPINYDRTKVTSKVYNMISSNGLRMRTDITVPTKPLVLHVYHTTLFVRQKFCHTLQVRIVRLSSIYTLHYTSKGLYAYKYVVECTASLQHPGLDWLLLPRLGYITNCGATLV